jgi:hypothetical protein
VRTLERFFDPQEVHETNVSGRAIIYFDTNVWATLADAREEVARRCIAACTNAVDDGRALFPLSYASVSELFEHPNSTSRQAQAAVMDALSLGVTFRAQRKVYDVEAAAVTALVIGDAVALRRELLFTYVIECLGDARTTFADSWSESDALAYVGYVRAHPAARSLAWWVNQDEMLAGMRMKHALSKSEYVSRMQAHLENGRHYFQNANGSLNRVRALREEHLSVLKNQIVPRLRNTLFARFGPERTLDILRSFTRLNGEGGERRLIEFVALMPSLKVFCEIMAARTMNPARAVREQDFWDVEHAAIGSTHATAFATLDRGLLDLIENRCETPRRMGCRFLHDIEELTGYVASLRRATEPTSASTASSPS